MTQGSAQLPKVNKNQHKKSEKEKCDVTYNYMQN